ncbi:Retrovirus-related Pol polyprotein from transposon, partial [Nosema granulosis]
GVMSRLKNLLISERWTEYGGIKSEDSKRFLNQFLEVEDAWTSEKLLKMVRSKLKSKALLWFDAHSGDAIQTYEDFKELFRRRYIKEDRESKHKEMFWKLFLDGPKYQDIVSYACELKIHAEKSSERFISAKEKIGELIRDKVLASKVSQIETWGDLFEVCEEHENDINTDIYILLKKTKAISEVNQKKKDNQGYNRTHNVLNISLGTMTDSGDSRPRVELWNGRRKILALLDTGANVSLIRNDVRKGFCAKMERKIVRVDSLNSSKASVGTSKILVKSEIDKLEEEIEFVVMVEMCEEAIIGYNDIRKLNLLKYVRLNCKETKKMTKNSIVLTAKVETQSKSVESEIEMDVVERLVNDSECETEYQKQLLKKLLEENCAILKDPSTPRNLNIEHAIDLIDNSTRIMCPKYRRSPQQHELIKQEVENFLKKGLVEEASSRYISPVCLVRKPDGKLRFCIDYRRLNKITIVNEYPIPRIDETVEQLQTARIFTTLDLKSGYHQVQVRKEDRDKTAFFTREGVYRWKCMPFGLINASFTFQRVMNRSFKELLYKNVMVYQDDIMVYSPSFEKHIEDLEMVLKIIKTIGFTVNTEKCRFMRKSTTFLGFDVGNGEVSIPMHQRMKAMEWKLPTSKKEVRSFNGFCNFFSKFIKGFAEKMIPLYDTVKGKKTQKFELTKEAENSFRVMNKEIHEAVALNLPNFGKTFYLYSDASNYTIGASLMQEKEGEMLPLFFISRKLNKAEINYTVTEKECLAIVWACKQFRPYLANEFVIRTDHQSLKWLFKLKEESSGRLMRWIIALQEYSYKIEHIQGKLNLVADTLTRFVMTVNCKREKDQLLNIDRKEIILNSHTECGHGGVEATYVMVLRTHSWKGMYGEIVETIKNCDVCSRHSSGVRNLQKQRIKLGSPFDKV